MNRSVKLSPYHEKSTQPHYNKLMSIYGTRLTAFILTEDGKAKVSFYMSIRVVLRRKKNRLSAFTCHANYDSNDVRTFSSVWASSKASMLRILCSNGVKWLPKYTSIYGTKHFVELIMDYDIWLGIRVEW